MAHLDTAPESKQGERGVYAASWLDNRQVNRFVSAGDSHRSGLKAAPRGSVKMRPSTRGIPLLA